MKNALLTIRDIHGPYMQLLTNLQGENGSEWLEALKKFNRKENPWSTKEMNSLTEWFTTRKGLWVSESFTKRVLKYAKNDGTADISTCDHIDLPRNMYDSEIITKYLGGMEEAMKNAFTLNQVKAFITAQWNCGAGPLLTNSYANIFYCIGEHGKLFAVVVDWASGGRKWIVGDWELGGSGRWDGVDRVFRNKN
jgi:hypothetical protein